MNHPFTSITFVICFFSSTLFAQNWQTPIEILDTAGSSGVTGHSNVLKIVNGKPAIAFYDVTHTRLQYVYALDAQGTSWSPVITVDNSGSVGLQLSLEVVNGNPAIAYYDNINGDLRYVRAADADGATWNTPIFVDSLNNKGKFPSLKVVNGFPAISYQDVTQSDLMFVRAADLNGNSWGTPITVMSANAVANNGTSLAVVNGNPAIAFSYTVGAATTLRYVAATDANGANWSTSVGIETGGFSPQLLVINGNPAISHFTSATSRVKFVRATNADGSSWGSGIFVSTNGETATNHALAVVGGFPTVSYYDQSNTRLKICTATNANGSTWAAAVVADNIDNAGLYNGLVELEGQPAVSFTRNVSGKLCFRKRTNANGNLWTEAITWKTGGALGEYANLEIVNGFPAICYYDQTNGLQKYIRSLDAQGETWGTPISISQSTDDIGKYCKMKIVNGNPAISFYNTDNENIGFKRADNVNGSSWPLVEQYVSNADPFQSPEMELFVTNNKPSILFYSQVVTRAYLKNASDVNGTNWSATPFTPESAITTGRYLSVATIAGFSAFSHYDQTNGNLRYIRATNVGATTWGTPSVVDQTGDVGQFTSLAEVNGAPAIAYYDVTNNKLKFVRATNSTGSTWATPISVTPNGSGGKYTALAVLNGKPIIFYQGGFRSKLYAVQANDSLGTTWGTPVIIHDVPQTGYYTSVKILSNEVFVGTYCLQDARPYFIRGAACESPISPINVTPSQALQICEGQSTILQVSGNNLSWFDAASGGNLLASGNEFSTTALNSTVSFYVSSSECNIESNRIEIPVNVSPLPNAEIIQNELELTALPAEASYQWILCDGTFIDNATQQNYMVESAGSYSVIVNLNGCVDSSACVDLLITNLNAASFIDNEVIVYPNPAKNEVNIKGKHVISWQVLNTLGRVVQSGKSNKIITEDLETGIYTIVILDNLGTLISKRIFLQKEIF